MIGLVPKLQTYVVNSYNWSDRSKKFLNAPGGPFTSKFKFIILLVHFWCPFAKWLISVNNIYDVFYLETSKINASYQFVIFLTGAAFSRFALLNYPKNYHLSLCNGIMAASALYQMSRKL
jgi:hypothetical protein